MNWSIIFFFDCLFFYAVFCKNVFPLFFFLFFFFFHVDMNLYVLLILSFCFLVSILCLLCFSDIIILFYVSFVYYFPLYFICLNLVHDIFFFSFIVLCVLSVFFCLCVIQNIFKYQIPGHIVLVLSFVLRILCILLERECVICQWIWISNSWTCFLNMLYT